LALKTRSLNGLQNPQIYARAILRAYYFSYIDFEGWEVRLLSTHKKMNEATTIMQNGKPEPRDEMQNGKVTIFLSTGPNEKWRLVA
jgi:hypothetical protein